MIIEPPVAFLPRGRLLNPELFAKVFTDEWMRVELPRVVRIFASEETCSS